MTKYDRLSHSVLLEALRYDPQSGHFTWNPRPGVTKTERSFNGTFAGKRAGAQDDRGYRHIKIHGAYYREHRLAVFYMTGAWPVIDVDHRDLDKSNNAWANLREADETQNGANTACRNKLGLKGVTLCQTTGRYTAKLQVRGVGHFLGRYDTAEEAHAAYTTAAERHFGEFARSI